MLMKSYFRTSGFSRDSIITTTTGESIDLQSLAPFLRTLMVMDGTVTKALSAWFWEPVAVLPSQNKSEVLTDSVVGLEVKNGDAILAREVNLCGDKTQRVFASARSIVSLKHLPEELAKPLEKGEMGIGELLREKGVETYRDIFDINYYPQNSTDDALIKCLNSDVIARSYRIRVNSVPAIIVTEFFPIAMYSA